MADRLRKKSQSGIRPGAGDYWLVLLMAILVAFGVIMVFSASYYTALANEGSQYYYLIREIRWVLLGAVAFIFFALVDYHRLVKMAIPIYIIFGILCVALTHAPVIGKMYNGAYRWIGVGPVTILPGEFAKLAAIIFCAWWLTRKKDIVLHFWKGVVPLLAIIGLSALLIYVQPSTTTAATMVMIVLAILIVAGAKPLHIVCIACAGVGAVVFHMIQESGSGYRSSRLTSFLNPFADPQGDGFQVVQGIYALASGGLKGVGLGNSVQKSLYLPDPQNDFILSIIGEELGYIGIIFLLAAYLFFIWRCTLITMKAPDAQGKLMGSGITIMFALHVILNCMVVASLFPPTGIALPFVSYGGTAMLLFMSSAGVMVNISRYGLMARGGTEIRADKAGAQETLFS